MNSGTPQKPSGESPKYFFMRWVWDLLAGGKFPFGQTDTVKWEWSNGFWYAKVQVPPSNGGGNSGPQIWI